MSPTIHLKLKSINKQSLILFKTFALAVFKKLGLSYCQIALPKKKKRITLLKSPHVNKSAREQFEIKYYKLAFQVKYDLHHNFLKLLILNKPNQVILSVKKRKGG